MDGIDWNLDKTITGSHVVILDRWRVTELHTVEAVSKVKITLDDGTGWTRSGRRWGAGSDRGYASRPSLRLVTDLEKVCAQIAAEKAQTQLESMRQRVTRLDGRKLTAEQCAAILAIAEPA